MGHQIILGNLGLQHSTAISRWVGGWVAKKSLDLVVSNLTAPVRVLLLLEDERVAGEVGRCDEVDLDQHCNYCYYYHYLIIIVIIIIIIIIIIFFHVDSVMK